MPASLKLQIVIFLILYACLDSRPSVSDDNLQAVMARMKPSAATVMDYQEFRHMRMMSAPWTGSGHFYAIVPDTMIKEQLQPESELMAIRDNDLYYFNQTSNQKHQAELSDNDTSAGHIEAFKGLMNGDLTSLKLLYNVDFKTQPFGWLVTLTPKNTETEAAIKIIMHGKPEQAADKLELLMADGDHTEFLLGHAHSGADVNQKAMHLLDLLSTQ